MVVVKDISSGSLLEFLKFAVLAACAGGITYAMVTAVGP